VLKNTISKRGFCVFEFASLIKNYTNCFIKTSISSSIFRFVYFLFIRESDQLSFRKLHQTVTKLLTKCLKKYDGLNNKARKNVCFNTKSSLPCYFFYKHPSYLLWISKSTYIFVISKSVISLFEVHMHFLTTEKL
jgi:hypothetical protein